MARFNGEVDSFSGNGWSPVWVVRKPRSTILLAQIAGTGERVIVKRQHASRRDIAAAMLVKESQYHELFRTADCARLHCSTPHILATYPDLFVQIVEYVDGETLLAMLLRGGFLFGKDKHAVVAAVDRAGRWLSSFTARPDAVRGVFEPSDIVKGLLEKWTVFEQGCTKLATRLSTERLAQWLYAESNRLEGDDLAAVSCHGDFAPGNILVGRRGKLFLLDFASGKVGTRLNDACYFLHQLWHFQFNPLISRAFLADARMAFVQSFGEDRLTSRPLYRLEKARQYLASLQRISLPRRRRSLLSRAHDRWFAAACVRELEQLSRNS